MTVSSRLIRLVVSDDGAGEIEGLYAAPLTVRPGLPSSMLCVTDLPSSQVATGWPGTPAPVTPLRLHVLAGVLGEVREEEG